MQISFFSFAMAILWSSALTVILYIGRRTKQFLRFFGASSITVLYVFCALRMLFPIEFPFTYEVHMPAIYNHLWNFVYTAPVNGNDHMTYSILLLTIWFTIAAILLIRYWFIYTRTIRQFHITKSIENQNMNRILRQIQARESRKIKVAVIRSSHVQGPMSIGIFQRRILLPDIEYDDETLYYILLHEYTHLKNKDLLVKLLSNIYCCIFWWNPTAYLLLKDLEQSLELKCDMKVSEQMVKSEKSKYLSVILHEAKRCSAPAKIKGSVYFTGTTGNALLAERFKTIERSQPYSIRQSILMILTMTTILCLSYTFQFQTYFDAPINEIETTSDTFEVMDDEMMVLKKRDGSFELIDPYGKQTISKETADMLIEDGIKITEEK